MKYRKVTISFNIGVEDTVPLDRTRRGIEVMINHELRNPDNLKVTVTDEPPKTPIPPKN